MRAISDRLAQARRRRAVKLLDRWVGQGDLPDDLNRDLALDLLIAPLYWRMVVQNTTPTRADLAAQSRAIATGLKALGG